jgi:hypothetical protein
VRSSDAAEIGLASCRAAAAVVLLAVLTACAHVHVNPDGSTRVFGFVAMTIPPAPLSGALPQSQAPTLSATTWGLSWFSSPIGASLSLGYSHESITRIGFPDVDLATRCVAPDDTFAGAAR